IVGLWLVQEPLTDLAQADRALRALAPTFGGAYVPATEMLLAVPGTKNTRVYPPHTVEVMTLEPERRYPLDALALSLKGDHTQETDSCPLGDPARAGASPPPRSASPASRFIPSTRGRSPSVRSAPPIPASSDTAPKLESPCVADAWGLVQLVLSAM